MDESNEAIDRSAGRDWDEALETMRQSMFGADLAATERACHELIREAVAGDLRHDVAAEAAMTAAKALYNADELERAEEWARQGLRYAQAAGSDPQQAAAWIVVATVRARLERPREAIDAVIESLSWLGDTAPPEVRRTVYLGADVTCCVLGFWPQATDHIRAAIEGDEARGQGTARLGFMRASLIEGLLYAYDDLSEAAPAQAAVHLQAACAELPALEQVLASAPPDGLRVFGLGILGAAWRRMGRPADALVPLVTVTSEKVEDHGYHWIYTAWVERAAAHAELGQLIESRDSARRAVELVLASKPASARIGTLELRQLWRAQRLAGDTEEALESLSEYLQRIVRNAQAWMDAQTAGLTRRLSEQALQLQNSDLRERNAGLTRRVEDATLAASTDALTGVLNRRALLQTQARLAAQQRAMAMLMIDVDHFKQVNDRFGHLVGDRVLVEVAGLLQATLRHPDSVGRYGGEEFVVLLPGVEGEGANVVAERLRSTIAEHDWPALATGLSVTVSVGCTLAAAGESFEAAFQRADAALYRAKREGRNRVVSQTGPAS